MRVRDDGVIRVNADSASIRCGRPHKGAGRLLQGIAIQCPYPELGVKIVLLITPSSVWHLLERVRSPCVGQRNRG